MAGEHAHFRHVRHHDEQIIVGCMLERLQRLSGLSPDAYCPSCGLAENAVCIAVGGTHVVRLDPAQLARICHARRQQGRAG